MLRLFLFAALSLIAAFAHADLTEVSNSVCRINAGVHDRQKSYGTGFAYKEDEKYYYILTAGHLIGINDGATVSLYHTGKEANVVAEVIFHSFNPKAHQFSSNEEATRLINDGGRQFCEDVTVLRIEKEPLIKANSPMSLIKFKLNYPCNPQSLIWTYGCPEGNWPTGYKGRLVKKSNYLIQFSPAAVQGRSGSLLMDHYCEHVIGVITMLCGNGHAVNIDTVYEMLKEKGLEPNEVDSNTNSGPGPTKI